MTKAMAQVVDGLLSSDCFQDKSDPAKRAVWDLLSDHRRTLNCGWGY
ncbi:MAG: hypothetical protein ACLTDS_09480 [Bianqueaceae bacterium]